MRMRLLSIFVLILVSYTSPALATTCQSSTSTVEIDKAFLQFLKNQAGKKKTVAIMPFFDNHVGNPDDALYHGLPSLIFDMFNQTNDHLMHPYISFKAIEELGISDKDLINKEKVKLFAENTNASFVIFGAFQRSFHNTVRVMINIYDHKKKVMLSPAEEFTTSFDDSFFSLFERHLKAAFSKANARNVLRSPKYTIPPMKSFRYYSKGISLADSYSRPDLEMAVLWFEKALKENYHNYDDAALQLARAHFMLALIQKLNRIDFTQNMLSAQKNLQYVKNNPKKGSFKHFLTFRYVDGHRFSVKATAAYAKKSKSANVLAAKGLAFVPEDGVLQNIYLTTLGSKKPMKGVKLEHPVCF